MAVIGQYPVGDTPPIGKDALLGTIVAWAQNGDVIASEERIDVGCIETEVLERRLHFIIRRVIGIEQRAMVRKIA
ncbi:hypothetical protein CEQ23_12785 [Burkholderia cepacia]|uniref:Uncharacterized protein n=1 Tax=Burkholderia cepacia TaxID=292 RepID=A0ABM6NR44_BURCE|nr:hypothetical protein APZ15_03645 [Burkholderia cepacia ATCC 25416]ASE94394.1 hypothetical protein CEQ23_12785 [Burkholderia cepacia]ATF77431.1 hypothetical protein CO711_08200 [Burkholderia cepacia]